MLLERKSKVVSTPQLQEFHSLTISPFINVLMKEIKSGFDLSELPVLTAFPKSDPAVLPESSLSDFLEYGMQMHFTISMEMKQPMNTMVD